MNQRTRIILRYLFVALLGTFLHFAYDLSSENPIVGLFALVNESVWEHLKLLYFPMLVLTLWDILTTQKNNLCFLPARVVGILYGLFFIVVSYYSISGVLGFDVAWINILIFLLSIAYAFRAEKKYNYKRRKISTTLAIAILLLLFVLFILFTMNPPALGIFTP